MRFKQLDKITELEPGARISAVRALSLSEEYLRDHFPHFPVMPGVLMLEALYQASAWLLRVSNDFATPLVTLKEARNVKYADFVSPGNVLTVQAEIIKQKDDLTTLKTKGLLQDTVAVSARLILESTTVAARFPKRESTNNHLTQELQYELSLLWPE